MKILSFIVNRANYGRLQPVLTLLREDPFFELVLCCTGTTVENEFGNSYLNILDDGHTIKYKEKIEVGQKSHASMAETTSNAIRMATQVLQKESPDITLLIGDRYETLGIAIASSFLNIPIAHIQGGELSGSIDENIRHSITKLSHLHFVATERSKTILIQLGEQPNNVFNVGCPSGDIILNRTEDVKNKIWSQLNSKFDIERKNYILAVYHPTTTEADFESERIKILLESINVLGYKTIWLTPNSDAGSRWIMEELNKGDNPNILLTTSLHPTDYIELMNNSLFCIGNSSSFLRDSSFLGVPVILVGNRQNNREFSNNLIKANFNSQDILNACNYQIKHKDYAPSTLYGTGESANKIVDALKQSTMEIKKEFYML